MRRGDEIRGRLLAELAHACRRPTMFGGELYLGVRLHDLAYIDGVEDALEQDFSALRAARIFTSNGVGGWFRLKLPTLDSFDDEVASVYGVLAARHGWLDSVKWVDHQALGRAKRAASAMARRDVTWADVEEELGEASFCFGDTRAYAAGVEEGWVFFDFAFVPHKPGHYARDTAPATALKLRNVRVSSRGWLSERFRFTPLGRAIRLGEDA